MNVSPVAINDTVATAFETLLVISPLNNDYDPLADSILVSGIVTAPANGIGVLNANGTITYTPSAGFTGLDSGRAGLSDQFEVACVP